MNRHQFNQNKSVFVDYLPLKQSEYLCERKNKDEHMEMTSGNYKLLDNPK